MKSNVKISKQYVELEKQTWSFFFNNTLTNFNKYVTKWRVGSRKWKGAWSVDIYSSRVKRNN